MTTIAIVETDGSGGLIHFAYQMASALTDAGADVTLFTSPHYELRDLTHTFQVDASIPMWRTTASPTGRLSWVPRPIGAVGRRVRRAWRAVRFVWAWERLTRTLLRARPDVIQFSIIRFPFQERYLRRLTDAGITLTQVCHEFDNREMGRRSQAVKRRLSRHLYDHFSAIFFLGEAVRDDFHAIFETDRTRTHVIPHGDESLFLRAADRGGDLRACYGISDDAPVAGFFGGLRPSKGVDDLIEAFGEVLGEMPNARLVIAGLPTPDIDIAVYRTRAVAAGVAHAVTIDARYLPIDEVGPFIRSVDVVALPYRTGTASGALQTAYAFARPVITTKVGSVAEAVVDGVTGYVTEPSDITGLSRALIKVLSDRAEAHRMGCEGRRHAAENHAWAPIASRVIAVTDTARSAQ